MRWTYIVMTLISIAGWAYARKEKDCIYAGAFILQTLAFLVLSFHP